ncbi:unnamed protein product, partial [Ixodes persulcatus]
RRVVNYKKRDVGDCKLYSIFTEGRTHKDWVVKFRRASVVEVQPLKRLYKTSAVGRPEGESGPGRLLCGGHCSRCSCRNSSMVSVSHFLMLSSSCTSPRSSMSLMMGSAPRRYLMLSLGNCLCLGPRTKAA